MHEVEILYTLKELTGLQNPYSKVAEYLANTIHTFSEGDIGKLRYKGQTMRSLFNCWHEYENRMHLLKEEFRTSDEVIQFIKEEGTTLFNTAKQRTADLELSDYEVEGVRKWMIKIAPQMY
jgi:hypothetical protein